MEDVVMGVPWVVMRKVDGGEVAEERGGGGGEFLSFEEDAMVGWARWLLGTLARFRFLLLWGWGKTSSDGSVMDGIKVHR